MTEKPKVGDVWYRYYTRAVDEGAAILCDRYRVLKVCPSSVWLSRITGVASDGSDLRWDDEKFLVGINCRSSRAKPTREEAWKSYIIRTRKRISHLANQLSIAEAGLSHAENSDRPKPGDGVWVSFNPDYPEMFGEVAGKPYYINEMGWTYEVDYES